MVASDGGRADQDGVAAGAYGVDPVEVGRVGERQRFPRRAGEVAVDRHGAAQQGVGTLSHAASRTGTIRAAGGVAATRAAISRAPGRVAASASTPYDGGGRNALAGAQAGGAERPRGHALRAGPSRRCSSAPPSPPASASRAAETGAWVRSPPRRARPGTTWPGGRRPPRRTRARCPATTRLANRPTWRSVPAARRVRAQGDVPRGRRPLIRSPPPSTPTTAAATTSETDSGTGDGRSSSTLSASASWTTCPAERSQATARRPRPTSPASRPWRTARSTSPSTPPGSTVLRNCDR